MCLVVTFTMRLEGSSARFRPVDVALVASGFEVPFPFRTFFMHRVFN
jgi:hypothetical protein